MSLAAAAVAKRSPAIENVTDLAGVAVAAAATARSKEDLRNFGGA